MASAARENCGRHLEEDLCRAENFLATDNQRTAWRRWVADVLPATDFRADESCSFSRLSALRSSAGVCPALAIGWLLNPVALELACTNSGVAIGEYAPQGTAANAVPVIIPSATPTKA